MTRSEKENIMSKQWMHRSVVPNKRVAQFCGGACSVAGASVLLLGIGRLERLELTESQLYSAMTETLLLAAAFTGLALHFSRWRREA